MRNCRKSLLTSMDGSLLTSAMNQASLRRLLQMNAVVAAAAGVLKDYAEESAGTRVQSPILAHPQFERLEAEGAARGYASRLRRLLRRQP